MYLVYLIPIIYLAAVAETALGDVMRVGNVAPDLIALVAIVWLLTAAGPRAFLVAGVIVLVGDLIAPGRLGLGMGWMLLIGYAVTRQRARFDLDHLALQVFLVAAVVTTWAAAVGISGRLLGDVSLPWSTLITRAGGVGLYTAGVALPVLMVLAWIREPALARRKRLAEF